MVLSSGLQVHTEPLGKGRLSALAAPLSLYGALLLVLTELFRAPLFLPAFLSGAAVIAAHALWRKREVVPAAVGLSLVCLAFPSVRNGLLLFINRLFAVSEAANAYAYDYLRVPEADETAALRAALAAVCILLGAVCAGAAKYRAVSLLVFLALTGLEVWFGVTPAWWKNLLLFAALALQFMRGTAERRQTVPVAAGAAAILLLVLLLAPRPNGTVERYSEHLRDVLEASLSDAPQEALPPETEVNRTHRESRQHEEEAKIDPVNHAPHREVRHETEVEREISLPHRIDYFRIALLILAVILLLIVPFLPFLLLNRTRKRRVEIQASFANENNGEAICAMFAHLMTWLHFCGLPEENRPFSQCGEAVRALLPDDLAARFSSAVPIWQEAAYSDHQMTAGQRETVCLLLRDTSKLLYARSPAGQRFRMKAIHGLCEVQ